MIAQLDDLDLLPGEALIPIADIVTREDLQVRSKTCPKLVSRYAADLGRGARMPPILCYRVDVVHYVVDGFHRLAAHRAIQLSVIKARVIEGTLVDAKAKAATANLDHGQPVKPKEMRKALRLLIESKSHMDGRKLRSYRELADMLGNRVSYGTVRNWIRDDFPSLYERMGGGSSALGGDREPPSAAPGMTREDLLKAKIDETRAVLRTMTLEERRPFVDMLLDTAIGAQSGVFQVSSKDADVEDEDF